MTTELPTDADAGETDEIIGREDTVSGGASIGMPDSFAKKAGFDLPELVTTFTSPS